MAGAEQGTPLRDNLEAFSELGLSTHLIGLPEKRSLATSVMGQDVSMPVLISPTDLRTMLRHAPEDLLRPRWLLDFARTGHLPGLTAPNMAPPTGDAPTFFGAYGRWMFSPSRRGTTWPGSVSRSPRA